jgi:CBS domain-containing protein
MAKTISEVMTSEPVTVDGSTSISQVAHIMREHDIGDVLVTDDKGVYGVVTDRDIVVRAVTTDGNPANMKVGDICSRELVAVNVDDGIDQAVQLMREHALRRLPVLRDQQLVGVVSIGDLAVDQDRRSALADISAAPPSA